jgi:hypothetical protein
VSLKNEFMDKYERLIRKIIEAEQILDDARKKLAAEIIKNKIDFSDFKPDEFFNEPPDLRLEALSGGELALSDDKDNANYIDAFINHKGKITYKEYKEHFMTGFL